MWQDGRDPVRGANWVLPRADRCSVRCVACSCPPLKLQVRTPRLVLAGAAGDLLERLIPVARAGVAGRGPHS